MILKNTLTAAILVLSMQVSAQILRPVKWSYAAKKTSKTEAVLFIKASIDDGWHLYSQDVKEGGPVKTTFTFPVSNSYVLIGKMTEPAAIIRYEKVFGMNVSFFEHSVIFQQKIRLKASGTVNVKGTLEYMTCNDQQCLPPEEIAFSIAVK